MSERPHVVIVGGGFGGLYACKSLRDVPVRITLVDRYNHHLFQPLLYQVATAALNPSDIAYPIRSVVRKQANVRVLLAEARSVAVGARVVQLRLTRLDAERDSGAIRLGPHFALPVDGDRSQVGLLGIGAGAEQQNAGSDSGG